MRLHEESKMVIYCPRCGTPNEDNAQFCSKCGYHFPQVQQQMAQQQGQPTQQTPIYSTSKPKKSRKKTWIVVGSIIAVVIIVILVGTVFLATGGYITGPTPTVTVTAVDLTIQYTGLTSGYLGPTSQSLDGFTTSAGSQFTDSITFTSSSIVLTHNINNIYVNTPGFTIDSISPNLPYSFSPGSTFTITITMTVPANSYTGVLNLVVSTS
jgi:ribosomal protein L37E